ncbi:MAG TPA: alpha/beta fold hydrolase [Anaerolineae bacterium]|nr:alpha/beta fold hydrolase [Anaerolineae bacterium]
MDVELRERFYTIFGQPIHTVEAGQEGRQVAILIHGWSSSWYATSPMLRLLSQRFHCVAVDLPGYGKSERMARETTIPRYVDLLAGLIEQVSDGPVVLVGHSMGGMISVTLAMNYPVLVERMVLLCPTISGNLSTFINLFIMPVTLMERFGVGSLLVSSVERIAVGITDVLFRPALFAERSGITRRDYERIRTDARQTGQGRVRAECFRAMRDNDLQGSLKRVQAPALIIWGAEDNTVPLRDAGIVADEWPEADLRIIPKAGHWPHFEVPDITSRHVASYLGLPRSSTKLYNPVGDEELAKIREAARFLAHSDIGNDLNLAQRTRLAAQCRQKIYNPGETIAKANEESEDLYIIQGGTVEVWSDPQKKEGEVPHRDRMKHVATFRPGQMTGELALLDQGTRSADLVAGTDGAVILMLDRERLLALCEDDAVLGTRLLWNMATAMSRRVRFILWQLNRAGDRQAPKGESALSAAPQAGD